MTADRRLSFRRPLERAAVPIAWLAVVVVLSLGSAGIVTGIGGPPGTTARPELTWSGDQAIRPGLQAATDDLSRLTDDVDALGTQGRGAIAALVASDTGALSAAVDAGSNLVDTIGAETRALKTRLAGLPGISGRVDPPLPETAALVLGADVRQRFTTIVGALDETAGLALAWERLSVGALAATRLTTVLADHDASTATAAKLGHAGKYAAALAQLDTSDEAIATGHELRDRLANSVDVTILDQWLLRNGAYDAALRTLYSALQASKGRATAEVRAAFAAEEAAKANLPPDTRGLVVIMAEIARGGLNQAVIGIEQARGRLSDALAALAGTDGDTSPRPSGG